MKKWHDFTTSSPILQAQVPATSQHKKTLLQLHCSPVSTQAWIVGSQEFRFISGQAPEHRTKRKIGHYWKTRGVRLLGDLGIQKNQWNLKIVVSRQGTPWLAAQRNSLEVWRSTFHWQKDYRLPPSSLKTWSYIYVRPKTFRPHPRNAGLVKIKGSWLVVGCSHVVPSTTGLCLEHATKKTHG